MPTGTVQRILGGRVGREASERNCGLDPRPVIPQALPFSASVCNRFERQVLDGAPRSRHPQPAGRRGLTTPSPDTRRPHGHQAPSAAHTDPDLLLLTRQRPLPPVAGDIAAAHRGCLPAAVPEPEPAPTPATPEGPSDQADTPARRHAKQLFEAVHAVTHTGCSLNAAARELGLNWRTVRKYAQAATWEECVRRSRPRRPTSLDLPTHLWRRRCDHGFGRPPGYCRERARGRTASTSCSRRSRCPVDRCGGTGLVTIEASALGRVALPTPRRSLAPSRLVCCDRVPRAGAATSPSVPRDGAPLVMSPVVV